MEYICAIISSPVGLPATFITFVTVAYALGSPMYHKAYPPVAVEVPPASFFHPRPPAAPPVQHQTWLEKLLSDISPVDVAINVILVGIVFCFVVFEKIQARILGGRVKKLRACLSRSQQQILKFRQQKENVESTIRMVKFATQEYDLLLFLLLEHQNEFNRSRDSDPPTNDTWCSRSKIDVEKLI